MKVAPDTVVTLAYRLFDEGEVMVDEVSTTEPIEYVHGYAQILPGLDQALEGMTAGESARAAMPPALAFGERADEAMLEIDRQEFPGGADVQVGDEVVFTGPDGVEVTMPVVAMGDSVLMVDLNHPLAGQTVRFDLDVLAVRLATDEEIDAMQAEMDERIANERGIVYDSDLPGGEPTGSLVQLRRRNSPNVKDPS